MRSISDRYAEEASKFKDIDALGLFVDNHDNARFLNGRNDQRVFKSALAFTLTARGIPFYYYGSEQGFAGGNDPQNRETIWSNLNKDHDIYKFTQTIMNARKAHNVVDNNFQEKWVDEQFYAYTRGKFLVALTNQPNGDLQRSVPNTGFNNGETVCNIFNSNDCQQVNNGSINVYLRNGEVKIYVSKANSEQYIQE